MLCEDAQANPLLGLPVVTKVVTTGNRAGTQTKPTGNRAGSGPVIFLLPLELAGPEGDQLADWGGQPPQSHISVLIEV